jgi:transposase-like protein
MTSLISYSINLSVKVRPKWSKKPIFRQFAASFTTLESFREGQEIHDSVEASRWLPRPSSISPIRGTLWRMANGEWRMANGEWRMANGEWRMANGEWQMANSE